MIKHFHQWIAGFFSALLVILFVPAAMAKPHQALDSIDALDSQIALTLEYLSKGNVQQAQLLSRQIAWRFPDFALGQLIHAELESVSAFQDVLLSDHLPMTRIVSELLLEAQRRLAASTITGTKPETSTASQTPLPANVVQIGDHISQLVVVDLQASVLYQYNTANQTPLLVRQHYVGSGEAGYGKRIEGDLKTPLGVYTITGYRSDNSLPDLYGSGALTLDYPNTLDRHLGRTGYGIWLHGVPSNQDSRTPYSSEGCVTMSNEHMSRLSTELDASSTRIILTNDATSLPAAKRLKLQTTFSDLFRQYQDAWLNDDNSQLLKLYGEPSLDIVDSGNHGLARVSNSNKPTVGLNSTQNIHRFSQSRYQQAFSAIQPEQLSIFTHPDVIDGEEITSEAIVTNAVFGPENDYQITIYWIQLAEGEWRILTETAEHAGL